MNSIVLYTNGNQECERARMLLEKLNSLNKLTFSLFLPSKE